jgi:hypothetical protein
MKNLYSKYSDNYKRASKKYYDTNAERIRDKNLKNYYKKKGLSNEDCDRMIFIKNELKNPELPIQEYGDYHQEMKQLKSRMNKNDQKLI